MPMTRWYMLELCNKDIKAAIFKMQASNSEHSWNKFNIKCNCKNIEDIKDQMESTVTKIKKKKETLLEGLWYEDRSIKIIQSKQHRKTMIFKNE